MATEADIPPPVCETRAEQGFHIADQATNISHNKLPQEEKNRADTHNEPATVAGEDLLPTPSIDQVPCEVNKMSSDATEKDETVVSLVTSPELDDQSLQSAANAMDPYEMIQHKDEKSNVSDKDVRVETELSKDTTHGETTEEDISGNLATSDESKEVECEHNKIPPERNFADSLEIAAEKASQEPKVSETEEESPLVQVDDEQFEKESEKLPLADLSADGNEPEFIDKVIYEKEGPTKAQLFETEENITTLPVESLHEVPEIIEASDLSQENKTTSSSEERSTNANQHVIASDDTEEKTIDAVEEHKEVLESFPTIVSSSSKEESITAESESVDEKTTDKVDTQQEVLEDFPTVVQNEEIEENSNKVDGSDTTDEETLEKGSEEMSLPLPLASEANVDEPMVMHEAGVDHGELRKTEFCENESTESIEKPEDSLNVVSKDIKESDPDQEIETRSHTEEQIEAAQPQADLDEKTDDKVLDVAETKEENLEKTERGFHIADQATNPADTHNEPGTVEGEDFLTTPSVDQVHCEVNETSSDPTEQPDQTEKDETVISLLRSPELDDQSLQSAADAVHSYEEIQQTAEKSNVSDKDVRVETEVSKDTTTHGETTEEDISGNLTTSDEPKEVEREHNKMPPEGEVVSPERNFADSLEIGAESASQDNSSSVETITNTTSGDEFQEKNNLDSSFCEDDTTKAELFETEENITTLLKEDVSTEKPVEFLQEVPEITEASDLSQENKTTSSPEEDSTNANQHVIASDDTEEKTIDAVEEHKEVLKNFPIIVSSSPKEESVTAESECTDEKAVDKVDTQKEILEDFSAVVPNEEIEENSKKVDGSNKKDEDTLEKESDEMSLPPLPLAREANDDESIIKPEDSLNVVSEDIKESDLDREIETRSYTEEQIEAAQPQAAMDEKTDDKTLDAAETKEEILENMPTCILDEKTEGESSLVQDDSTKVKNEDHSGKDSEEASNDDVITTMDEVEVEVEYPSRAELFQEEKNDGADFNENTQELQSVEINVSTEDNDRELEKEIVTPSLEEASTKETPEESTESTLLKKEHLQDHEASASSDDIEINHTLEDQSLTAIPHAITSERTIDPTDTKAVCLEVQNVATEIPHMESEAHLVKESEKSSLTEETNETESKNLSEPKEDKDLVEAELSEKENNSAITLVTEKTEDIMESDFGEKTTNPQEISSDKPEEETIDAVDREEEILHVQGIAASIPDGDNEDKSLIEEDCSQHPSSNETSSGQANDDEAAITREANFVDESLIKTESFKSEKNAEVTLVKEEVSIESLQVAANDIKDSAVEQDREISFNEYKTKEENHEEMIAYNLEQVEHLEKDSDSTSLAEAPTMDTVESTEEIGESGSGQSTETTSTEEQILTEDTQEISCDKTEEKSDDAAYTKGNTIDAQDTATNEDSSPIEEDCSDRPSTIIHEAKLADQNLIKAELFETEESTEGNLAKEELSTRSLEVSDEASASDQDRETSSIATETIDATETPEDKNVATTTLHEETEENSLIQVDCQKEDLEKESENTSQIGETTESTLKDDDAEVEKAADSIGEVDEETNDNYEKSTIIHESEVADQGLLKAELFENEKNTEGNLAHEEVSVRSLEVSDEDIKASGSGKDREISSIEEDNTIDATETPEDKNVATTLHEETEKNSPIQVDCQKEHSEKERETTPPTGETAGSTLKDDAVVEKAVDSFEVVNEDINESKLADQNLIKAELLENEESTEGNLAKDEVSIRSLEVSDEDIKATASGQGRETCSIEEQGLTTSPSGIIDDQKEDKTIDATETPEDKNVATTTLHEESEENSPIQVDYQKEDLEKESEDTSQTVEISESTLKDDALVEKVVDSFEVVKEDTKASAFVSTGNDNYEESTVIHESKVTDQSLIEAELFENAKSAEVYLAQQEVSIRSLEVSDEDIKASTSGQDIETCSIEEKGLTTSPSGIIDDQKEDKTIDATESPEDKNVATTTLHEKTEENSPIQVDCQKEDLEKESEDTSQTGETTESTLKDDAVVEKAADSFEVVDEDIKAPAFVFTGNDNDEEPTIIHEPKLADQNLIKAELFEHEESTEGDLAKEEVSIRSLEVSDEDIKTSASGQDREICSLEEQGPTTSPSGIIDDQKEDKAVDATESLVDKNVATTTLHDETENNSLIQVDCQKEYLEKETENTSQTGKTTESTLKDDIEEQIQNADLQEISCDKAEEKTFDATYTEGQTLEVRDVETDVQREQNEDNSPSSIDVETPTAEAQETLGDEINEQTTDVTDAKEDCLEVQDITTNASNGDDEDNSPTEADSSQNPSLEEAPTGNAEDHESIIMHQAKFVDENLIKANLVENEKTTEGTLIKEETESLQLADGDIKAPASCEDREISPLEEQSIIADPTGNTAEEKEDETIDPTDLSEETSRDKVPKEIDAVETKAVITELNEEEIHLRDLHMTNAVDIESHEENASSSDAVKIPSTTGSDEVSEEHILENEREIQQDPETEEAHKQDEDLHVSAPCQDSSMEKIDKDVQLCLASTNNSDVTEEVLPARDDNITEKTDIKESEVLKDDKKPNAREQEETECGQILLDETVEETKELVSIPVANDAPIMSFTETSEVDHFTSERELTIDREELQTEKTAIADDKETRNDEDKGEEIGLAHEQKIPELGSAATNVIEARDQDVAGFLSEAPEETGVAPEEKESEHESKDQVLEFEKGEREYAFIGNVMVIDEESESSVIGVAPEERESEYESKNQVLESIAQVQSCDIIPKATEMKTEEDNTETAAEMKSGNVLAEDIFEPKITPYEKESMKVDISSEKGDEDLEDNHLGSCKEEVITERCLESELKQEEINTEEIFEVITNGNETEKVSEVSEETDDKAVEHPETILLANESIDHQKELGKSGEEVTVILDTEEVKSSNMAVLENEEKRIGAADKEVAKDEVLLNQNSNTSVIDETAVELPKALDENIICEAPPTETVHETIEEFAGKNEDSNTKHESLPLPEFTQGKESEKQDQKYEICTPEEQAEDEEKFTAGKGEEEAEGAGTWTKPTEDEDRNTFVQAAELDEVLNGDGAQDIPVHNESSTTKNEYFEEKYPNKSTETQISSASEDTELIEQVIKDEGVDSRQVEEVSDECKQIKETSTLVEPATIPTSEIMQEYTVETSPETKDQLTEVDNLPQESNVSDVELKMAQRDGPPDLQNARDISENVQELNEGSVELPKKENPVEVYPSENIEAKVSSEEQKTEINQKVLVPETPDREIEEQQPGSTYKAVLKACEEDKIIEKVSELQSSMEDTAQNDKKEETERQIDSLPVLPHVKCSDIETEEKDLPLHSDVAELEVIPLPSNDKHVVLEPSKCEPEEANSGHKEGTSQTTTESKEIDKPSLMDLLQTPTKKTSEIASRSEDVQAEKTDEAVCEDVKSDEEKDDEEESSEQRRPDLGSEAPVMVDMGDADLKTPHKKSHNILSGVGSKVKHSIAKVKKAITGKSSHPKPPSPK
ncbi:hypothetical protein ABFS83_08G008000 [Erythranthe nasuta]